MSPNPARKDIRAGFMPLVDCAPLVVAAVLGFAEEEGLGLTLERETSWATVRDRIGVGHLDASHMLAPMPIAANLGLTPLATPMIAPLSLGSGGNTVTMSRRLWAPLEAAGAPDDLAARPAVEALASLVATRKAAGLPPLMLAIVHPHSAQYYQLSYWLAAGGVDPIRDVELIAVPPSLMPAALAAGQIDGFCAGEPWGSVAVAAGSGFILTTSAHIWRSGPEKVLGVRRDWADQDPERLQRLLRAVWRAAQWCDQPANRPQLAGLLARPEHLGQPAATIINSLERRLTGLRGMAVEVAGLMTFSERGAAYPWTSHAAWLYTQMVRWRQIAPSREALAAACGAFRPDLARAALAPIGANLPLADAKVEGTLAEPAEVAATSGTLMIGPNLFFDGAAFDPEAAPSA